MRSIETILQNKGIDQYIIPTIMEYVGKQEEFCRGELYLHYAFYMMNQYSREYCRNNVSYSWANQRIFTLIHLVPYINRMKTLKQLRKAMKHICYAPSDNEFIKYRVGKLVQRPTKVLYQNQDEGYYKLSTPFMETEESLREIASIYYRDIDMAICLCKTYNPYILQIPHN
jgi:hypothetical protein